jgi:SacI restriction endonuclease
VGIRIPKPDLERELDAALREAASASGSGLWVERVVWLTEQVEEGDGKTYVAALGAALLAKATDPTVDSLTQALKAGPNGYSLRSVAEFLQSRVRGHVHLGTLSKNPVNNSPFLRGPARIDRFDSIGPQTRPIYDMFVRWLDDLNGYDKAEAHDALVSFLHERTRVQRSEDAASAASLEFGAASSLEDLTEALQLFAIEDPEGGSRGQAVVAAVLASAFPDIEVVPKNHPAPFDVKRAGYPPPLVCEVKQQLVRPKEVMELTRRAFEHHADRAIYAALDPSQGELPVNRLVADALVRHGVFLDVCYDVRELVARVAVYSDVDVISLLADLPDQAAVRCEPSGVGKKGRRRLEALLRGIT